MLDLTPITPPRVPLIDPRTGLIERSWYMFFLSLFKNAQGAEDALLVPNTGTLLASYDEALRVLAGDAKTFPVPGEQVQSELFVLPAQQYIPPSDLTPARAEVAQQDVLTPATEPPMPDNNGTVASASTLDLTQITSSFIEVLGTTTVTAIVIPEGQTRVLRFAASLTLTNGASLLLPDALNIKTMIYDYAVFRGYASSITRCVAYLPANVNTNGSIASATTVDLTTVAANTTDITGTTTITGITLVEGVTKIVRFTGALVLTNGASLVLPGSANITTVAGDYAVFRGYASGIVRCVIYSGSITGALRAPDGTVSLPAYSFALDTDSGFYRIGSNNIGLSLGGVKVLDFAATALTLGSGITSISGGTNPSLNIGTGALTAGAVGAISATVGNPGAEQRVYSVSTLSGAVYDRWTNSSGSFYVGKESSAGGRIVSPSTPYAAAISTDSNYPVIVGVNNTAVGTFSSTGLVVAGSIQPTSYKSSDGSTGYTGSVTTSLLVGKTITIKDGLITNFA